MSRVSGLGEGGRVRVSGSKKKVVITYGTFDLLHEGHINLLRKARALGDVLIVGVTSEAYDRQRGKLNVRQSLSERIENVKRTGLADLVIVEEYEGQKIEDVLRYDVDIFAIGSDWKGKFDYLKPYCEVVYLERTRGISSTDLRGFLRIGIVGTGRIARRFVPEARFVSGAFVTASFHPDERKAASFAEDYELLWGGSDWSTFLDKVDAVYVATPHHLHVDYSFRALEAGKHVLVEKPMALRAKDAHLLFDLAAEKGLTLVEALKTAYLPAFRRAIGAALSGVIGEVKYVDATFTKLVREPARELDPSIFGGSFTELGSYVLLPMAKLWGRDKWNAHASFISWRSDARGVDLWTSVELVGSGKLGYGKVGLGVKGEGALVIGGTEGYIYVPAPWWRTSYFEIRRENSQENRVIADAFEGEGLRYEIAEFVKLASEGRLTSHWLTWDDSVWMASVIENFLQGANRREVSK